MNTNKIIALDFDGTCVMHEYPRVGADVPYAVEVLKKLNANDVRIILWTMRSNEYLQDAVDWFAERGIEIWAVNENPQQKHWTQSPKAYAPVYIDDAALGCPLKFSDDGSRPFADWVEIEKLLEEIGYLDSTTL
jgi:hypothetical protein